MEKYPQIVVFTVDGSIGSSMIFPSKTEDWTSPVVRSVRWSGLGNSSLHPGNVLFVHTKYEIVLGFLFGKYQTVPVCNSLRYCVCVEWTKGWKRKRETTLAFLDPDLVEIWHRRFRNDSLWIILSGCTISGWRSKKSFRSGSLHARRYVPSRRSVSLKETIKNYGSNERDAVGDDAMSSLAFVQDFVGEGPDPLGEMFKTAWFWRLFSLSLSLFSKNLLLRNVGTFILSSTDIVIVSSHSRFYLTREAVWKHDTKLPLHLVCDVLTFIRHWTYLLRFTCRSQSNNWWIRSAIQLKNVWSVQSLCR